MSLLARVVTRSYKYMIVAWVVLAVIMAVFAIRLPSMLQGDGFEMDAEHAEVMDITTEVFGLPAETMFLVFEQVPDEQIKTSLEKVNNLGVVSEIVSPLEDETLYYPELSYAMLHFDENGQDLSKVVAEIREQVVNIEGVYLTGQAAVTKDINEASQRDLMIAEAIGLPIAIVVLLFAFGSVMASFVPLLIGLSAVIVSFGVLTIVGGSINLSIFTLNITPMLGLALSIDFALLFISRYREERRKNSITDAVATTIRTAGRSVVFSAFCVFIGLGAMMFIQVDIFISIALGGMVVVSMAVLSSITLLPSVLIALGDHIDKWQVIRSKLNGADRWRKFAQGVIKRPVRITIAAVVLLGIFLLPVGEMDLTIPQIDSLPESYDSRKAYERIATVFEMDQSSSLFLVATRTGGWADREGFKQIKQLEERFKEDPLVDEVTTVYSLSGITEVEQWEQMWNSPAKDEMLAPLWESFVQDEQLLMPMTIKAEGASTAAQEWVRNLEKDKTLAEAPTAWLVGGEPKFNQEIFDEILDKIGLVIAVIMASTFFVLMIAFRSLLIPLKAIIMNVIGLAATFGILVYIFQFGHFGLPEGTIALIIPVIVFSLVFGLSMDYEVFLISRMQEEYYKTLDNDHATVEGLAITSKIITSAALIMIVLTGAFAFTDVMPVKQIGVGIAIAVAIDATIIRLLLVPSLMKLFGKWNWWLPFVKQPKVK